ncbi:exonuclease V [Paraphysoderma sedebokerense]|nr:exonuclease V [Paraphysoderma sedebokerense]
MLSAGRPPARIEKDEIDFDELDFHLEDVDLEDIDRIVEATLENKSQSSLEVSLFRPDHAFLEVFNRKRYLSVSNLSSLLHCEYQTLYANIFGSIDTAVKSKGQEIHSKLESEVVTRVEVRVKTIVDRWILRIINLWEGLEGVIRQGRMRELEVWGWLNLRNDVANPVFVIGIIDEIAVQATPDNYHQEIKNDNDLLPKPAPYVLGLVDTKTQISSRLRNKPSDSTRLQLMLYHNLLMNLMIPPSGLFIDPQKLSSSAVVDLNEPCSEVFINGFPCINIEATSPILLALLKPSVGKSSSSPIPTLASIIDAFNIHFPRLLSSLPPLSPLLTVSYIYQSTLNHIGHHHIDVSSGENQEFWRSRIERGLSVWQGLVAPEGTTIEEAGRKCRVCEFVDQCDWRRRKEHELQNGNMAERPLSNIALDRH